MTPSERLAMQWALRELRRSKHRDYHFGAWDRAVDELAAGGPIAAAVADAAFKSDEGFEGSQERWIMLYRILRARLALALRALLRADAGDYGPERAGEVGVRVVRGPSSPEWRRTWTPLTRRYAPLWEQARR